MAVYIDLNIINGDLSLDDDLSPVQFTETQVISQDVKHRILESGLLVELVGLRNKNIIEKILTELELVVEQDDRIIPGSIEIIQKATGQLTIKAETTTQGEYDGL